MKRLLLKIGVLLCLLLPSCKTIYLPSTSSTETHIKDSTVWNIKDSIRIIERSRYKDYGGLLDTLRVKGNRSSSKSWVDTTRNVLNTELVEEPIEEKTKIIYRDRWKTRDSIQVKKEYYPIEIEKEKTPTWSWYSLIFNIVGLLLIGFGIYLKIKKKGI